MLILEKNTEPDLAMKKLLLCSYFLLRIYNQGSQVFATNKFLTTDYRVFIPLIGRSRIREELKTARSPFA